MNKTNRLYFSVFVLLMLLVLGGGSCPSEIVPTPSGRDADNKQQEKHPEQMNLALKNISPSNPNSLQIFKNTLASALKDLKENDSRGRLTLEKQLNEEATILFEKLVNGDEHSKKLIAGVMDIMREEGILVHNFDIIRNNDAIRRAMCSPIGDRTLYQWKQMGYINHMPTTFIRAIVDGAQCPRVQISEFDCPRLKVRAAKDALFPVTSCEISAPISPKDRNSNMIAVIGDTGCDDVKGGQNCSVSSWPFETISKQVSKSDANLIVHTGDYVYRKISGSDDSWKVWEADFFKPADSMFGKAPFVFVRGNHEQCKESPKGWYRFLAPGPYTGNECARERLTLDEPYEISWGDIKMLMLDSSSASDMKIDKTMVENLADHLSGLNELALDLKWQDVWLLTHRPVWACAPAFNASSTAPFCPPSGLSVRAAWDHWKKHYPDFKKTQITKVLSGHVHLFSLASFNDQGPLQMIVGNSGTILNGVWRWQTIHDGTRVVNENQFYDHHGYVLMSRADNTGEKYNRWEVQVLKIDGTLFRKYVLVGSQLLD